MPDDDRKRRRLGDETKGRIADLASGWDSPGDAAPVAPAASPRGNAPRKRSKADAGKALDDALDSLDDEEVDEQLDALEDRLEGLDDEDDDEAGPVTLRTPPAKGPAKTPAPALAAPLTQPLAPPLSPAVAAAVGRAPAPAKTPGPTAARPKPPSGPPPPPPPRGDSRAPAAEIGEDSGGWEQPTTLNDSRKRAHKPSQVKSGPTETGTVDVSGIIPAEKTQPPELLVPPPSVDASGVHREVQRSGAHPIPKTPSRPGPPPPPGARSTGGAPIAARPGAGLASASEPAILVPPPGPTPAPLGSGASGSTPPGPPPAPLPAGRLPRASFVVEESSLAVPVGEFDAAHTLLEQDKLRVAYEQATIKRDASSALLGLAEAPQTVVRETPAEVLLAETAVQIQRADSTGVEPQTKRFERADPSGVSIDVELDEGGSDATRIEGPSQRAPSAKGRLRTIAQLRRTRGVGGDLRYVLTAIFGVRRSRRELAALEAKQATRLQSRRRYLTTLGRTAVTAVAFDHPALGRAREQLAAIENDRARHAGEVAAADAELQKVTREREATAKDHVADLATVDAELAALAKKLEPLEKEVASATRRAADLRDAVRRLDEKIAITEAGLAAVKTETKEDRAAIQAEVASLKADKKAIQADEPQLAAELDSLHPRVAALEASRADARKRRAELEQAEADDRTRTEELLAAIGARRKVVDRAAAAAETRRDKVLLELGERLYVDRPKAMSNELSPIDAIDVELGTGDRRIMELRETLTSIDRMKIARGVALWILILGAIGVAVYGLRMQGIL